MNIIKDILISPEIVEQEKLNAEFIHLKGPMLFRIQMDFRYMVH